MSGQQYLKFLQFILIPALAIHSILMQILIYPNVQFGDTSLPIIHVQYEVILTKYFLIGGLIDADPSNGRQDLRI